jgi:hypothetical protein
MLASVIKYLRWFFGGSDKGGVAPSEIARMNPPSDLDQITKIVRRDGPMTKAEYAELKRHFKRIQFPDTSHKPPRKQFGTMDIDRKGGASRKPKSRKHASKRKRKAA